MHTVLILTHITCMVASLLLMPTAVALAMRGIRASMTVATNGLLATGIGFITGIILLFDAPLLTECVILTSYLVAVIAIYAFGFGWGVESKARLLKSPN